MKYNHRFAFKLTTYECVTCGNREVIYNGRDGSIPWAVECLNCEGISTHRLNTPIPTDVDYVPPVGSRVFVSIVEDMVETLVKRTLELHNGCIGHDGSPTEEDIRESMMERIGEPIAVKVDEDYLNKHHLGAVNH